MIAVFSLESVRWATWRFISSRHRVQFGIRLKNELRRHRYARKGHSKEFKK